MGDMNSTKSNPKPKTPYCRESENLMIGKRTKPNTNQVRAGNECMSDIDLEEKPAKKKGKSTKKREKKQEDKWMGPLPAPL